MVDTTHLTHQWRAANPDKAIKSVHTEQTKRHHTFVITYMSGRVERRTQTMRSYRREQLMD